ncbi:Signal transduction histidine kinase [Sphingomonas sp. EC-HK361]|uniref:sensor histidine kinase n=1 Tax=Sphingomonas sp. EC-HK361 TaxID=2038397 RepID=UPI001257F6DE|nr:PAS domain-containing sensor histidine kinase [Sphingomonas sp. EC-HK361]VVT06054.1 Signal transduction histidine kinase [Sphingomonas sp. EC-HK361]
MVELSVIAVSLGGGLLALLILGAGILFYKGLRLREATAAAEETNVRLAALLASAPAMAFTVRADRRIDMAPALATVFGFDRAPADLGGLRGDSAGLGAEDHAALARGVEAARTAGRDFSLVIIPQGGARTLVLRGARAGDGFGTPGAVVIWVFDATDSEARMARLRDERDGLAQAYDALTGLIEAAPLPMWYRGGDLKLSMVNSAYVAAVEARDAGEVIARGLELVEAVGAGGPLAGAAAAKEGGRPHDQAVPVTIDGARRMMRVIDVPLPTGGVAGFALDIDELEQAQGRLVRFGEAQRAMLDRLSAGVAQFSADRSLIFCNQPFRRMFAMRTEWLADRPEFDRVLDRMREANRLPEVRDFPGWKAERRDWFVPAEGAIEETWHLVGGTHIRVVAQPLPDGGLLLIFEDRTEQVQLASARDTLLRVRTATFDNLFEALGVFAADGRLQLWNNRFRALWGFEEEFLSAHPRVDTFAQAAADRLANPARASLIGELVRSATIDRQQRGGRVAFADGRHFEFAAVPLPDGNALFTMLDISDSRRIEQALRDRNEALVAADSVKTAFVANMSYELRTPLTSISGFAEMLHGGYAGKLSKDADGYVEAILDSVERLGVLVDDVLDLTQSEANAALTREDIDLGDVARAAVDTLMPLATRRKVDFVVEISRTVGRASGDPKRIRQAVEHLLRHAISAVTEGGRVLLHADGSATRARIVVSDDGAGMDADAVAHAFDRFARPGVTGEGERALGLGLPLAKQFVEAHRGTVQLVSEPGAGTLVTIELPRR